MPCQNQLRAVNRAFGSDRHSKLLEDLRRTLDEARWIRFKASSTGNDIVLQFKLPGRRAALRMKVSAHSIDKFEHDKYGENNVLKALWNGLAKHWPTDPALDDAKRWCGDDHMAAWDVHETFAAVILERAPTFKGLLYATIRRLRDTGEHRGQSDSHQSQLALKDMRASVMSALKHGTTREQLLAVVDEEIVRQVMEA